MINNISSFSEISRPKSNTLIVLDIDETIITFPTIDKNWWTNTYTLLYPIYYENTQAQIEMLWNEYVSNIQPKVLDSINLFNFLNESKKNNCDIIFLTARYKSMSLQTLNHLKHVNIIIDPSRIFYNKNKGQELKNIVINKFRNVKNIIFVDDLNENLLNVQSVFSNNDLSKYNIKLYKIKHI